MSLIETITGSVDNTFKDVVKDISVFNTNILLGQQRMNEPNKHIDSWVCSCGMVTTNRFCPNCGSKKPEKNNSSEWKCPVCHNIANGKFCNNCGSRKQENNRLKSCPNCGNKINDPANPPRFCNNCGNKLI